MKVDKKVEPQENAWQVERQNLAARGAKSGAARRRPSSEPGEDTVEVGLAHEIKQELAPERSEKIARLKALIAGGEYKPDLQKVAQSVANTIDEEVFFARLANEDK